jgi:hypothetical protein
MLDAQHHLTGYSYAPHGHVTFTARVRLGRGHSVELALAFATTDARAVAVAGASLAQPFAAVVARYAAQWKAYDASLHRPASGLGVAAAREYYRSLNVVRASEDKTFPEAIAAGLASPGGHGVPGSLLLSVASPANGSSVGTASVSVTGSTTAGATVDAEASGMSGKPVATASTTANPAGHWSLSLPIAPGSTTLTVTATSNHRTGYAQLSFA